MKAKNLRIGNLLSFSGEPVAINAGFIYDCDYWNRNPERQDAVLFENVEPIPLTAEWFEKCGGRTGGEQVLFISMPKIKAELHFEMKPYGNVIVLKSDFGEFVPEDIEYVHQLQNLFFAVTGEELTIRGDKL